MKYRITAHRRRVITMPKSAARHEPMDPISFNADSLEEMRAAVLKAKGTRFAYRVTVSCYLAAYVLEPEGASHQGNLQWREVNP